MFSGLRDNDRLERSENVIYYIQILNNYIFIKNYLLKFIFYVILEW